MEMTVLHRNVMPKNFVLLNEYQCSEAREGYWVLLLLMTVLKYCFLKVLFT
jgi:hypothetical protein